MFDKILIANRGEIACRVIRTARRLGVATVAVYSDADRGALHVQMADEAVSIGPAPSSESYLVMDRIIQACRDTGAQAVHPGYGFLSENAAFCEALEREGIIFIGPAPHAITSMGDKITSKKLAAAAGVNTIPGCNDVVRDPDHAVKIAEEIGYPVMLKASAGGGGKGMRVAYDRDECRDGFERATNEARASFGDARVFIEKYIEEPRHIEIQVLADAHGHVVYLGERECSIQRRHQKVIEEAPSPFLDAATRRAMGEQAVALTRAVQYRSAGTVEFIVDAQRNFYFLEMNTRLQVEHPVTELVTGLDLVELMLRVADGQELPFGQDDVRLNGWALEARVYAEDPFRNFLPSIGRLVDYQPPVGEHVRVDTGVFEGGEVSMFYDPMIAKLVTWGEDRGQAIDRMQHALDQYYIRGVRHNLGFLNAVIAHPRFVAGRLSTNFIAEEYADGFNAEMVPQDDPARAVAVAATVHRRHMDRAALLSGQLPGHERRVNDDWAVIAGDTTYQVSMRPIDGGHVLAIEGVEYRVESAWRLGQPLFEGAIDGERVCYQVERHGTWYHLFHRGARTDAMVLTPAAAALHAHMPAKVAPDLSRVLLSPMPGLLLKLSVSEGQEVKAGEELAVVEAMKMENVLRAEQDAVVARLCAKPGDSLMVDQTILEFE
ncbi:MAG: acetyl/propionyl/methylcrotonyl-CoA carboxylase subunit alpha [Candidatus Krumholzibacteriia bacterium]